jgi:outer membrane protein
MRLTLLSLSLALGATALDAAAANLGDIYQQARKNDAVYAAAYAAYKAGLEKLPQGKALLYPTINLSANARHIETDSSLTSGWYSTDPYGFSVALSQPLYRKQNLESYEQAKLQALLAEQQLKLAEQDLFLRVAQAYFAVLEAQDNLTTAQAQKAAIAEQLALAKRSFEVGAATIVDTHEAQARYDATTAQEIAARNDLEVKQRSLERLIMAQAPALARLIDKAAVRLPEPNDMTAWVQQAETGSLGVAASQTAEEIARREIDKQRGGHLPNLDLAASYRDSRNTTTTVGGSSVDVQEALIGLELVWNLYQGGATDSRVREAVANQEKARFELDNARRQAALDARQAYLGVLSGDARVRALEQAVVSSEAQLKSTKLGLEVGVRTGVDVLNAQQQLFTAQRDLASARYAAILSGLQLKAAAGSLGEADLRAIDTLLRENQ